jgi:hypothetical protein
MAVSTPKIDEIRARLLKIRVFGPLGMCVKQNNNERAPKFQTSNWGTRPDIRGDYGGPEQRERPGGTQSTALGAEKTLGT